MECPKCAGGSYLVDEDLIQILEKAEPVKMLIKATYQCRACSDRFTRLYYDLLEARKKPEMHYMQAPQQYQQQYQNQYQQPQQESEDEPPTGLKFF